MFGLKSAMISGAFLVAYFGGGLLVAAIGARGTFALIAAGSLLVCLVARVVLSAETPHHPRPRHRVDARAAARRRPAGRAHT